LQTESVENFMALELRADNAEQECVDELHATADRLQLHTERLHGRTERLRQSMKRLKASTERLRSRTTRHESSFPPPPMPPEGEDR
jgi:hypothetical protein